MMKIDSPTFNQGRIQRVAGMDLSKSGRFQEAMTAQLEQERDSFSMTAGEDVSRMQAAAADQINPGDTTLVKLEKLKTIAASTDFSGMSYTEIYTSLWKSYDAAFGGNLPAILSCMGNGQEFANVNNQFNHECDHYVFISLRNQIYQESGLRPQDAGYCNYFEKYVPNHDSFPFDSIVLGYEGMSFEEKEAAIYEKYAGKNTLQDFLNMQGELFKTGVLDNKMGSSAAFKYQNILSRQLTAHFFPDNYMSGKSPTQAQWNSVYNVDFDARGFYGEVRKTVENMTFSNWDFDIQGALFDGIDYMLEMLEQRE